MFDRVLNTLLSFYFFILFQHDVWKDFGKNKQSIGELWVGFFRYYVEEFDFLRDVVTTRQTKRLTKFQKSWNKSIVAIEGK